MKKVTNVILIVGVLMLVTNFKAYSQTTTKSKTNYTKALTTDLINLFNKNQINIKYEQILGKKNSFTVDLLYNYGYKAKDARGQDKRSLCIGVGAGYRWYMHTLIPDIRTRGIEGFAIAPFANIEYLRKTISEDNYENDVGFTIGIGATYKFILFEGLVIEPTLRFGWGISSAGYYDTDFLPLPGVSIGYTW